MASKGTLSLMGFGTIDIPLKGPPSKAECFFTDDDRFGHGCGHVDKDFCDAEYVFLFHKGKLRHYIRIFWSVHDDCCREATWNVEE